MASGRYTLLLLSCLMLVACDPGYDMKMDIHNNSGHAVMLLPPADSAMLQTDPWYSNREGIGIKADSCYEIHLCGGLGIASFDEAKWTVKNVLIPDSAVFLFDDGRRLVYYAEDTVSEGSPYNFNSTHYEYSEKAGIAFNGAPYFGLLAYTLTQEQYEQSN